MLVQAAFMTGAYGAMCGLLVGIPFGLFTILGGALSMGSNNGVQAGGVGLLGGLFVMLLTPVFYGVFGLLGGAISGLFYNFAAHFAGGLKFKTG